MIAVTGADGFIGRALCARAASQGRRVVRFVHARAGVPNRPRTPVDIAVANAADEAHNDRIAIDLARASIDELTHALEGVGSVIHLAGRAHVMHETADDVERAYREANVDATIAVARAAAAAGVQRFIFASTVKVNGERTEPGRPFRPSDVGSPQDAYARSKLAAEQALAVVARTASLRVVTLRLPLVYGAGAKGNFRRLVEAVRAHRWLPLGGIDNRRSMLGIDNLLDAFDATLDESIEGTHFVADADSVSTPDLVRAIATALETKPRLVSIPQPLFQGLARIARRQDVFERLTQSLEVDTSSLQAATHWRPRAFRIDATMVAA